VSEHILVADDDPKQAALVRLYLERDGFDVAVVSNGRRTLAGRPATPPALIVLDVMMPEVDGLEGLPPARGDEGNRPYLRTAARPRTTSCSGLYLGATTT